MQYIFLLCNPHIKLNNASSSTILGFIPFLCSIQYLYTNSLISLRTNFFSALNFEVTVKLCYSAPLGPKDWHRSWFSWYENVVPNEHLCATTKHIDRLKNLCLDIPSYFPHWPFYSLSISTYMTQCNTIFTWMQDNSNLNDHPDKTCLPRENVFIKV